MGPTAGLDVFGKDENSLVPAMNLTKIPPLPSEQPNHYTHYTIPAPARTKAGSKCSDVSVLHVARILRDFSAV